MAKRQSYIEDFQQRLDIGLSELQERLAEIERRSQLWDSLDERATVVHATLISEIQTTMKNELTEEMQSQLAQFRTEIDETQGLFRKGQKKFA